MNHSSRYLFIFNPAANKGRAARKSEWLSKLLSCREDSEMVTTTHAGHAEDIARSTIIDKQCLIACGGDGTLHEVINAVAGNGITVGILPIGSANDFIKTLSPDNNAKPCINHLFTSKSKSIDLGRVSFGISNHRYFINSMGLGFTGKVAKVVKNTPWLHGELSYIYALLSVLARHKSLKLNIKITLEDSVVEIQEPVFAFSVSKGKIEGGKFRIAPHAELSDGLLDVCILKAVSKHDFFRYVLKYLKGTQISDPKVLYCKAKSVELTLQKPEVMHLDGEVYDNMLGKINISVFPQGLNMLCDHPILN
ncbi:MAG: diacylglycerol kinase family protein [Chlorobium sp.]|nr:MAG: diacylglycerol kinase family lipid kinase [Chlorobium sp.]